MDTIALARFGGNDSMPLFQVTGAVLSGDTIIIAERSTGSLHFYRRTGEFLRTVGGVGEGPGEFSRLTWVQKVGERLFAYDILLRRQTSWMGTVHVFDLEGHPSATVCYAWSEPVEDSENRQFYAVLHQPPVRSAGDAVRASIVQRSREVESDA